MVLDSSYFWGDLIADSLVGGTAAVAGWWLAGSGYPVVIVFGLAFLIGGIGGMLLDMLVFSHWLGAMETMFSTLLSGALGGVVGAAMGGAGLIGAGAAGIGTGVLVFAALAMLQARISAQARRGNWS